MAGQGRIAAASAVEVAAAVVSVLRGATDGPAALATVIDVSGSAPQVVGAKLLLLADDSIVGTIGGGAIEAQVIDACRVVRRRGRPTRLKSNLIRDLGMCCGGTMEVFVEYVQPQARLFVIGAGHVAQALVPVARAAGFAVSVFDDRDDMLTSPAFDEIATESYDVDELEQAMPDITDKDFVIIVTRDHARDEKALAALMRRPHRYIGMIGSRRKVHAVLQRIFARERQLGRADPDLSRVRAPVGLALGGRTPAEIAISIVAELIAEQHGGDGQPMSIVDAAQPDDGVATGS